MYPLKKANKRTKTLIHWYALLIPLQTSLGVLLFPFNTHAQCGSCTLSQTSLTSTTGTYTIPAGQTLCISSNYCIGNVSNWPGSCGNTGAGQIIINGTLRVCPGVTFKYSGAIAGAGTMEIMHGGRINFYGTVDCSQGLIMKATDPTVTTGTSLSSIVGTCNSSACEPTFAGGYAPFGVVNTGMGYTVNGAGCAFRGYPDDFLVLPVTLAVG